MLIISGSDWPFEEFRPACRGLCTNGQKSCFMIR